MLRQSPRLTYISEAWIERFKSKTNMKRGGGFNLPKHLLRYRVDKALVPLKGSILEAQPALGIKMDLQATIDNEGAAEHQENERINDCREQRRKK